MRSFQKSTGSFDHNFEHSILIQAKRFDFTLTNGVEHALGQIQVEGILFAGTLCGTEPGAKPSHQVQLFSALSVVEAPHIRIAGHE
jgi:hypothetical protein